ncbi:MAG: 4Fe-4S dicluster domain-containing protein [Lachnospiraceae bacterium]|nr:4Fe-4S dicluster domain-containing protein [Lachnospiraceae bacterium]
MYKCSIDSLPAVLDEIRKHYEVFECDERGAKPFFFPQAEDLMKFKTEGKNIELFDIRSEAEDFVVFGVHACDLKALTVLDNVFLKDPVDTYYQSRREHGIIITEACTAPANTCFCTVFGIDPSEPGGDVTIWKNSQNVYWLFNTVKGGDLFMKIESVLEEGGDDAVDSIKGEIRRNLDRLPLAGLSTDDFGAGKTDKFFNDPEWAGLSESCLGCGTCTFVCPTCQCYDIKDFNTGHGVIRYRCWDSCMYSEFTKMSAGQPRLTQLERFRQRFMHKLVYYPDNNDGMFSCVGCGRCLQKCPIQMNIVKVMKRLGGEAK